MPTEIPTENPTSIPTPTLGADMYSIRISVTFKMGGENGIDLDLSDYIIDKQPVTNSMFVAYLNANKDKFYPLYGVISDQIYSMSQDNSLDKRLYTLLCSYCTDWKDEIIWDGRNFVLLDGFEHSPVVNATWYGAKDYCAWKGKDLPTEPQWEYAATNSYITLPYNFSEWTSTLLFNSIIPYATADGRENLRVRETALLEVPRIHSLS